MKALVAGGARFPIRIPIKTNVRPIFDTGGALLAVSRSTLRASLLVVDRTMIARTACPPLAFTLIQSAFFTYEVETNHTLLTELTGLDALCPRFRCPILASTLMGHAGLVLSQTITEVTLLTSDLLLDAVRALLPNGRISVCTGTGRFLWTLGGLQEKTGVA
jgi:hypothetical protein